MNKSLEELIGFVLFWSIVFIVMLFKSRDKKSK